MTLVTRRSFVTLWSETFYLMLSRGLTLSELNLQNFNYEYLAKAAEEERDDYSKNISTIILFGTYTLFYTRYYCKLYIYV